MSKKSASPAHSSPLHREVSAGELSEHLSETDTNAIKHRSSSSNVVPSAGSAGTTPTCSKGHPSVPPLSQPLLEGRVAGSEMTAIQEERELG